MRIRPKETSRAIRPRGLGADKSYGQTLTAQIRHHVIPPEFTRGPAGRAKNPIQSTSPDSNRGNLNTAKLSDRQQHRHPARTLDLHPPQRTGIPEYPFFERKDVGPDDEHLARRGVREQAPLAAEHREQAGRVAVEELQAAGSQVGAPHTLPTTYRVYPAGALGLGVPIGGPRSYGGEEARHTRVV